MAKVKETPSSGVAPVRKRYTVHATIAIDLYGKDEEEAFERFANAMNDAAESRGIRDLVVQHSETKVVPYEVPPGAERWAPGANAIRFCDDDLQRAAMHDGSWWWTDGHAALRCEGEPPTKFRRIENPFQDGKSLAKKPRLTEWSEELRGPDDYLGEVTAHRATADIAVAIQAKFKHLVEASVPGVRWMIGKKTEPTMAMLGDTVVAFVMPFKADNLPLPSSSQTQGPK